jgi:hypothetical protein
MTPSSPGDPAPASPLAPESGGEARSAGPERRESDSLGAVMVPADQYWGGGGAGSRRRAGWRIPVEGLADGLRHPNQHERQ